MFDAYPPLTRRTLLARGAQVVACAAVAGQCSSAVVAAGRKERPSCCVWDVHTHLMGFPGTGKERARSLLKYADRVSIDRLIVFLGFSRMPSPSPKQFREDNDEVLRVLEAAPDRLFGFVYLNPNYVEESLRELDRCVRDGPMVGIKLWIALECNDPRLDPIAERAGQLKAVILQHAYWRTVPNLPNESHPGHVAELAARHPNVSFISAHSGNDWERGIRGVRAVQNVYTEVSGFDPTAGVVEMAVRELGAERVIYGSDAGGRSYASQLSKVLSADLSETERRLILGGNIERLLRPILTDKGIQL